VRPSPALTYPTFRFRLLFTRRLFGPITCGWLLPFSLRLMIFFRQSPPRWLRNCFKSNISVHHLPTRLAPPFPEAVWAVSVGCSGALFPSQTPLDLGQRRRGLSSTPDTRELSGSPSLRRSSSISHLFSRPSPLFPLALGPCYRSQTARPKAHLGRYRLPSSPLIVRFSMSFSPRPFPPFSPFLVKVITRGNPVFRRADRPLLSSEILAPSSDEL